MDILPKDIINIILEFQGYHIWRQGQYIRRISKEDPRRELLLRIPKSYKMIDFDVGTCVSMRREINTKEIYIHMQSFIVTNRILWTMNIAKYNFNSSKEYRDRIQYSWG
jgi:hypothetical protein